MNLEVIHQEIQSIYQRIQQAEVVARGAHYHYLDALHADYQQRLRQIDATLQATLQKAQTAQRISMGEIHAAHEQHVQHLNESLATSFSAQQAITAAWQDPYWQAYTPASEGTIASVARVGRLALPDGELLNLPALAPLLGQRPCIITGEDSQASIDLLRSLLLRAVVNTSPGALRLCLVDPSGAGSNLVDFLRLPTALRGDLIASRPEEVAKLLDSLVNHITSVIQTRLLNQYPTIAEYNAAKPELAVPYQLLAWVDLPAGLTDRSLEQLRTILDNGPRAGVSLLASFNPTIVAPRNFDANQLLAAGLMLHHTAPNRVSWNDPDFATYPVACDEPPPVESLNAWLAAIGQAVQQSSNALAFIRIATPASQYWQANTIHGLRLPIGMDSAGSVHEFVLGQGVVHHALIGGMIGSGKSNLLHVLIMQMALTYSPEEVAFYLVDFKEGVEFQAYTRLPHARVVALESEREFGLSVVRRLHGEMEERGKRFKALGAGIDTLTAYRQQQAEPLPRLVLVMDEFQKLFDEDDSLAREAGRLLEDIVRRGRVFGIHIILSSQSPAIEGMYRNRLYNQIGLRIALRCRAQDATAILGDGNQAASGLEQQGEAIYNAGMGDPANNVRIRIAHLPTQERLKLLAALQALGAAHAYPPPLTFESRTPARLEENSQLQALLAHSTWPARQSTIPLWLGQPVEIKPITVANLERYARSNLLIVGGDEAQAYGLLLASVISLAAQHAPGTMQMEIVDFARPEAPLAGLWQQVANGLPHRVEVIGARAAGEMVNQLTALLARRISGEAASEPATYLCIAGVQRWRELRAADAYGQTELGKKLQQIAEEGAEVGIHLLLWSDTLTALERAFKRGTLNAFDLRVALRLSESESNNVLGTPLAARMDDNRALFRHEDWESGRIEKFKPYAIPNAEVLEALLNRLRRA